MLVVKRYSNRKLYDTIARRYITLDGVADLIRRGFEIQVIDHASGDDLTTLTLAQILYELERKKSGCLPRAVLADLVRAEEIEPDRVDAHQLEQVLREGGVPTRSDLQEIGRQIDALMAKLDTDWGPLAPSLSNLSWEGASNE